jgi:hypothetical protein
LKEKALDRPLWRNRCGIGYGPVERETRGWMRKWNIRSLLTILWYKRCSPYFVVYIFVSLCKIKSFFG